MDEVKSYLAKTMEAVKERFTNPFVMAFVIAAGLWNYRILLAMFAKGDGGWPARIAYIEGIRPDWQSWILHGSLIPAAFALVWVCVLPHAFRPINAYHERTRNKLAETMADVRKAKVITEAERTELREHVLKQRMESIEARERNARALEDLVKENNTLLTNNTALTGQLAEASQAVQKANAALAEVQRQLMEAQKSLDDKEKQIGSLMLRSVPDFSALPLALRAAEIGLSCMTQAPTANDNVLMENRPIVWPFRLNQKSVIDAGIQKPELAGLEMTQDMVALLLSYKGPESHDRWIVKLKLENVTDPTKAIEDLGRADALHVTSASARESTLELTEVGKLLKQWLLHMGFRLHR